MAAKLKLERPSKFEGYTRELSNWLFTVHQFCLVSGVTDGAEMVKVAVMLLGGRALTWWCAVSSEGWLPWDFATGRPSVPVSHKSLETFTMTLEIR